MNVVDFAYQIIEMQQELSHLRWENKNLKEENEMFKMQLVKDMAHNEKMAANMLMLCVQSMNGLRTITSFTAGLVWIGFVAMIAHSSSHVPASAVLLEHL